MALLAAMVMLLPNYAEADLFQTAKKAKAKNAEKRRQEQAAWEMLDMHDKEDIQAFLTKFPKSSHRDEAKGYITEIDLWDNACSKNTIEAYQNYLNTTQLNWHSLDASENITYLQKARDKAAWDKVTDVGTIEAYVNFIADNPESPYVEDAQTALAQLKQDAAWTAALNSGNLADYEKFVSEFPEAEQKERERERRRWRREENGGLVNMGLQFLDFGWNGKTDDDVVMNYNLGLYLRIGNYADWVQFVVGVEPGMLMYYKYFSRDYSDKMTQKFHMPVSAHLKLNLFKMGESSRFFVFGKYQYNAVRAEDAEAKQAWSAGFGFSWKHFDWSLYYRQDMGKPESSGGCTSDSRPHFFGTTMTVYWKL